MNFVFQDGQGEEDDEDGASEAASLEEPKEEDQGEGYLSEMDNEPPVSESDDGFSVHNAPLQSHTLADSIPSSPASSQLWVSVKLSGRQVKSHTILWEEHRIPISVLLSEQVQRGNLLMICLGLCLQVRRQHYSTGSHGLV